MRAMHQQKNTLQSHRMKRYSTIVLCGAFSIDRIMNFQGSYKDLIRPDKIHVLSLSVIISTLKDSFGGIAPNIGYTLSQLGDRPIILGTVGSDGEAYIQRMKKLGLDTTFIYKSKLPTSTFTVLTDREDNQVGGFYPGSMIDNIKLSLKKFKGTDSFIVISAHDPDAMRKQVRECVSFHLPYMYDVSQQVSNVTSGDIIEGISHAQVVIVNDFERSVICTRTGIRDAELSNKAPVFITTLGHKGSKIESRELKKPILVPAAKASKLVDPTGAGDAYRAGFLYGYKNGFDLKTCGQIGAVSAVYAVEYHGTQEHSFSMIGFRKRYYSAFKHHMPVVKEKHAKA